MADNPLEVKLLPCPFCGSKAETDYNRSVVYAACIECNAFGSSEPTEAAAIAAWNTRATPDQMAGVDGEVTQADRDVAAAFIRRDGGSRIDESIARMYERGERDDQPLAQMLARHRRDAVVALQRELDRRDKNENRNCLNWGPCSRHDGRMTDPDYASGKMKP